MPNQVQYAVLRGTEDRMTPSSLGYKGLHLSCARKMSKEVQIAEWYSQLRKEGSACFIYTRIDCAAWRYIIVNEVVWKLNLH